MEDPNSKASLSHLARRAVLSTQQARDIFMSKPPPSTSKRCHASQLSKAYGVSPKTIRDVWVGRTWYRETYLLDQTKPASSERLERKRGRPKGAKDVKPRSKKNAGDKNQPSSLKTGNAAAPPVLTTVAGLRSHTKYAVLRRIDFRNSTAIDWADYLSKNLCRFSPFIDPFHGDWAFWPKDESDPC